MPDISLSLLPPDLWTCVFCFSPVVSRCFLPCSLLSWLRSVAILPLGLRVSGYFDCVHNLIQSQHESHLGAVAQLVHKHNKSQVSGIISDWCFCLTTVWCAMVTRSKCGLADASTRWSSPVLQGFTLCVSLYAEPATRIHIACYTGNLSNDNILSNASDRRCTL